MADAQAEYCQITLESKLASTAAPGLYAKLQEHRSDTVVLDASQVEQLGVLCMQILASATKTWAEGSKTFEVIDPSEAFLKTVETVGLNADVFGVRGQEENG